MVGKLLTGYFFGTTMLGLRRLRGTQAPSTTLGTRRLSIKPGEFKHARLALWDKLDKDQKHDWGSSTITVTLPDGSTSPKPRGTTPLEIARSISPGLAKNSVVSVVNGVVQDMSVPLLEDSRLEILTFDSFPHGRTVFWHSSAHILGQAIENFYINQTDVLLADGPALLDSANGGFFYEFMLANQQFVQDSDIPGITELCNGIVKRLVVPREAAQEMFSYNPMKLDIISRIPPTEQMTLYRCGDFIDLCRGPHIPNTGMAKAFHIINATATTHPKYEHLATQRIYGISFPDKDKFKEWQHFREEAERRDHRNIGKQQNLFMFSPLSPGCAFFLPHGTRIYNSLVNFIKKQYRRFGYSEVISPNIFKNDLWKISGHWTHYREDMFFLNTEETDAQPANQSCHVGCSHGGEEETEEDTSGMGLKPMNCPAHCLMFGSSKHSWRDLPIRFADFSALHRNEASGALRGLTRLRRFCQDDAHIFCRTDQIESEISNCIEFLRAVYGALKFEYRVVISTRPENFIGEIALWDEAEKSLETCLGNNGIPFTLNPGDGAFYGPKIDVMVRDALSREHQCGTIQLDFQLPLRFRLSYTDATGSAQTPVIIHRAMFGSIERMMAILAEHNGGKWPFWLSPRQAIICTISEACIDYAKQLRDQIASEEFFVDINTEGEKIEKKIRNAQSAQYNYILVVGQREMDEGKVNVRTRDNVVHGSKTIDELITEWKDLVKNCE